MSQIPILSESFLLGLNHEICIWKTLDAYGCTHEADCYFDERLGSESWESATTPNKEKALKQATRLIDRFSYIGSRTADLQPREFPRNGATTIPRDIEIACYEIALKLLEGFDIDKAIAGNRVTGRRFADVATNYNESIPEHISVGIPSLTAWQYLKPYLRNPGSIVLERRS